MLHMIQNVPACWQWLKKGITFLYFHCTTVTVDSILLKVTNHTMKLKVTYHTMKLKVTYHTMKVSRTLVLLALF